MIVLVDVDGVLRDWVQGVKTIYAEVYPDHDVQPITAWDMARFFPIGQQIYEFAFREFPFEIASASPPYLGAGDFLLELAEIAEIALVTEQPTFETKRAAWDWLTRYDLQGIARHVLILGSGDFKRAHICADVLLDDSPLNLRLAEIAGIRAVCMDRDWNRIGWSGERVKRYEEFLEIVRLML